MADKMLIDASHPEETRVVVTRGSRVEEFDFEAADKKQLRGNIYLAKVIRVEPSLQAAFVDYGGNRHGFLAFAEIHPDYYKVSPEDRKALLEEVMRQQRGEDEEAERPQQQQRRSRRNRNEKRRGGRDGDRKARGKAEGAEPRDEPTAVDAEGAPVSIAEATDAQIAPQADVEANTHASTHADATLVAADASAAAPGTSALAEAPAGMDAQESDDRAPRALAAAARFDGDEVVVAQETIAQEPVAEPSAPAQIDEAPATISESDAPVAASDAVKNDDDHDDEEDEDEDEDDQDDDEEDEDDDEDEDGSSDVAASGEEADERAPLEQIGGDAMDEAPTRPIRTRRQFKIQEVIRRGQILLVQVVKEERGNKGAALTTYLSLAGRYSVLMPNTARGGGISRKITDGDDRKRLKSIAQELEVPEGMGVIVRTAGASRTKQEIRRDFEYLMRMWETVRETTLRSSAPELVYEEGSLIKRAIRDLFTKEIEEIQVSGQEGYREAKDFMRLLMPTHVKNVKLWTDGQPIFARSGVEAQLDGMFSSHVTLKSGGYIVINQTEALVAIDVNSGRSTREHNIEDTALRTNLEAADEVARQLRLRDLAGLIVVDFIDMEEGRNNRAVERRMKDALKNDRARIQIGRISHFGLLEMSRQRIRTGVLEGSTVPCPHCMGSGAVRSTPSIALHVLRIVEDTLMRGAGYDLIVRTRSSVALYILNQKRANLLDLELRFGVNIMVRGDDTLTGATYHALERGEPSTGGPITPRFMAQPVEAVEEPVEEIEPEIEDDEIDGAEADARSEEDADGAEAGEKGEDGEARRRRRRRRRRGRGERGTEGAAFDPEAPQPSDEGLAEIAAIDGVPAEETGDGEAAPEGEGDADAEGEEGRGRSRRSRRRRGRGGEKRAEEAASTESEEPARAGEWRVAAEPLHDASLDEAPAAPAAERSDAPAWAPAAEPVSPQAAAPQPASEPTETLAPASQPAQEPEVEAAAPARRVVEELPEAPVVAKRSGWWARAKAGFTGS
jgi:ribonuclease E